jgi:hypothetical protein
MLSFTNRRDTDRRNGYLLATSPTTTSTYTPKLQFNSTGGANTVQRTGVGAYAVTLPGLGAAAGHVQITANGPGSEWCKVRDWTPNGADQTVHVRCFANVGSPIDANFGLTYIQDTNLVAEQVAPGDAGFWGVYAMADRPTEATAYPPNPKYLSDPGIPPTVTKDSSVPEITRLASPTS